MKQMKSYRMNDIDLAMIDAIKMETGLKSDTSVIGTAILELYYKTCRNASLAQIRHKIQKEKLVPMPEAEKLKDLKDEVLHDKS